MSFLARWFGTCGKVRFEGVTIGGIPFTGTTEIETFNIDNNELEEKLKDAVFVETGARPKSLKIVGFVEN